MQPKFDKTITRLELLLAEIKGREDQLERLARQFRYQLQRTTSNTVQGHLALDPALAVMSEVQERLDQVDVTRTHLRTVKERAQQELEALKLTHAVRQAQEELEALQAQGTPDEAALREISRLETLIQDYIQRAARSITERQRPRA